MRIGVSGGDAGDGSLDQMIEKAGKAEAEGFAFFNLSQIFGRDALTVLAVVGSQVPRIELATGVVPTWPRHPMMMAAQALTTQAASGERLMLGIGLSHQIVVESMWGYSWGKPFSHMRDYLSILMPLLHGEKVDYDGEQISFHGALGIPDVAAPAVFVAALGPKMLELTGQVADGTMLWMTGPVTIAGYTVPTITKAAADAGRPAPRIAAAVPVCVTDDVDGARERAARVFQIYGVLPSYRAMLDREGAGGPEDLAVIGDETTVLAGLRTYETAGVTDLAATEFASTPDERSRTRELLRSML